MNQHNEAAKAMEETARSLRKQCEILRKQAGDLMKEGRRIRIAAKEARMKLQRRK
jgi:regulator of replication initiation timing